MNAAYLLVVAALQTSASGSADLAVPTIPNVQPNAEQKMLKVTQQRMGQMAREMFLDKMNRQFLKSVPPYAELPDDLRKDFLRSSIPMAEEKGLTTEQGIVSYALAVLYLGPDFEKASKELQALLASDYPEVRKVHAMNEWVQTMIGHPGNVAAADQKLKQALEVSKPWGR
jgi:hypothetical protein